MSARATKATVPFPTAPAQLDALVSRVKEGSRAFARLSIDERISLLESLRPGISAVAADLVAASCEAKGIALGTPSEGDEWLGGPFSTQRYLRLLGESLRDIRRDGFPRVDVSKARSMPDGRLALEIFPPNKLEATLLAKTTAEVHFQPGVRADNLREHQAPFFHRPHDGRLCVVLGAGNVNSIPAVDSLQKLFMEGCAVILKMNPVNAYAGPFLERAFRPLVDRGFFAVVYGGAEEGAYLVNHALVDELHMTGSDRTHDAIVWGPPGPEREARKSRNAPLLNKPITSELGNVTPFIVVPGPYTQKELAWQASSIAGMLGYNASFNCNSPRLLLTWADWNRRAELVEAFAAALARNEVRRAYYPGAEDRWRLFTEGRPGLRRVGDARPGHTPFGFVTGVSPADPNDRMFTSESWCSVVAESGLPAADPRSFLESAVKFVNERVWGNLAVGLVVHPATFADPKARDLLESCIRELRYGTVTVNSSPIVGFGSMYTPWGGHSSNTLQDVQSGIGWGHNALMLEKVEKCVIRGPLVAMPNPPWWPGHRTKLALGRRLTDFEASPSWLKVPALAAAGLGA